MKKIISLFLRLTFLFSSMLFLVNCGSSAGGGTKKYTAEEIYDLAERSVGEIVTYNKKGQSESLGTCFAISRDGKFVTNYHVIENAYSAKITLNEVTYQVDQILAYDKDIDLVVVKVNGNYFRSVDVETKNIEGGATVYAVGSSEGYTLSFSTGVIASPDRLIDGVHYIQHEAPISSGNSGGPLFNVYGDVIGINTMTHIEGQNLNFAISCTELDNLVYDTPLTVAEFYEKECNAFLKMKNYIIENGSYDYEDDEYSLTLGYFYSDDYDKFTRKAYYDVEDDEIRLSLFINSTSQYLSTVYIDNTLSGYYYWSIINDDYDYMAGYLTASTFRSSTVLSYTTNSFSYYVTSSAKELAATSISHVLSSLEDDVEDVSVSASDLGFTSI